MDLSPILISLETSVSSILITFFIGALCAWLVFSIREPALRSIIDGVFTLPLVLPPTVAGFFLLYIFGVKGVLGNFLAYLGVKIIFSRKAAVMAAFVMSFPLMYRSALAAYDQLPKNIVSAARTMGMSEFKIFVKVMLPNSVYGLLSGGILAFARGLGEFGATAMIAGNIAGKTRTLPLAVYSAVAAGDDKAAAFYVSIIMAAALMITALINLFALGGNKNAKG